MRSRAGSKTALVLAGGGYTGAVYEIGALRAIDDLLLDRSVNDFDIFVGTSAGAFVSAYVANGISPEEMMDVLDGTHPDISGIDRNHLFHLSYGDYLKWGVKLPAKILKAWTNYLTNITDMTFFDLIWSFSETLPTGFYDNLSIAHYLNRSLSRLQKCDDFNQLDHELYIIATDLDTGSRAIFGRGYLSSPISRAVAASSALPVIYKPVRIGSREYIDGGMRGSASIDLAIERGAKLVVCINPLVPFDNQSLEQTHEPEAEIDHVSSRGVQSIANQTIRIFSHSGIHYHVKQIRRSNPAVDIILIEPKPEDYQMFFYNIMRYSARLIVAQHGFESVTYDLAVDYPKYKEVLARHGIPISRRIVIEELAEIALSNYDPAVIRKVLEAKAPGGGLKRRNRNVYNLSKTLSELDRVLRKLEGAGSIDPTSGYPGPSYY